MTLTFAQATNSPAMPSANNLHRFVAAQETAYSTALSEIKSGRKRSHWMWYIFPQIKGLGHSETARLYALQDTREAEAFLQHPTLGPRLLEISEALLKLDSNDAYYVLGSPDDLKLKSCMTLFDAMQPGAVFQQVLDKFYGGIKDVKTLEVITLR